MQEKHTYVKDLHEEQLRNDEEEVLVEDLRHQVLELEPYAKRAEEAEHKLQEIVEENARKAKEIRR